MDLQSNDGLFQAHASTWHGFTRLLTIGSVFVAILLLLLAAFLL